MKMDSARLTTLVILHIDHLNIRRLLAVGLETGEILIYSSKSYDNWGVSHTVPSK